MNLSTQDLQLIAQSLQLAEINHIDKDQEDVKIYVLQLIKRIKNEISSRSTQSATPPIEYPIEADTRGQGE